MELYREPVTRQNQDWNDINALASVSYTHLDVYKRQPHDIAITKEAPNYSGSF